MATVKAKGKRPALVGKPPKSKVPSSTANGISRASATLKGIADPIRLDILMSLDDCEMGVADLCERVGGAPRPSIITSLSSGTIIWSSHVLRGSGVHFASRNEDERSSTPSADIWGWDQTKASEPRKARRSTPTSWTIWRVSWTILKDGSGPRTASSKGANLSTYSEQTTRPG